MKVDFLIIGQGLAGSLLAWELTQRGCRVLVLDNGRESASQVAAGLINPVTGMRLVKSADIDVLLPAAKRFYSGLSAFFEQRFYIEKPMLRFLADGIEWDYCQKRLGNPDYHDYLTDCQQTHAMFKAPQGYVRQKQTGYLLTKALLASLKVFFMAQGSYRQVDFKLADIEFAPLVRWQEVRPRKIIFCRGYLDAHNPWFQWLPFQPVKGEILTLKHQALLPDAILNFGEWLIPLSPDYARVGATFDHKNLDTLPTDFARQYLLGSLSQLSDDLSQATVTQHQAHVRPCTRDKLPFVGCHPEQPQLAIFNGFGAKGSLQIPWYSQHFADCLLRGASLSRQCDILRFYETS